jgi:hypothetical protein
LLVRHASRPSGHSGYCGAGHEDHLFLIAAIKSVNIGVDYFLAQSGLKSISMDIEHVDELLSAIHIDGQNRKLTLRQSISSETDSFTRDVSMAVKSSRMKIITRRWWTDCASVWSHRVWPATH